jgi:hypothetical protein
MECETEPAPGCRSVWTCLSVHRKSAIYRSLERRIAMTRVFRWRWIGSSVLAWLVLAAVNAVAPAQAQAGCGHPWVQSPGMASSLSDLGLLESALHPSPPEPGPPRPSDRPGRCAGGSCSRSPEFPPSSTVQVAPHSEHWVDLPAPPDWSLPRSQSFTREHDHSRPAWFPSLIERPPRLNRAR